MSTISLRVPEEELNMFKAYAEINNSSLSEIIRKTMIAQIEDEYDRKVFAEYEKAKAEGKVKTHSHDEVWTELGL